MMVHHRFMKDPRLPLHWVDHPAVSSPGSPVLLLHGLGSSAEDWMFQIPPLSGAHRVIAVDLPGHGRTPPLPGWPRIVDYAEPVAAGLQDLDVASAHVVGLSLGGAVAMQLCLDHPGLVRSLCLINTFPRMSLTLTAWLKGAVRMSLLLSGRMDDLGAWVAGGLFPQEGQAVLRREAAARIASTPRRGYLQSISAATRFNVRDRLGEIQAPTLVIASSRDTTVPLRAGRTLAAAIGGARLSLLEGSGHVASVDAADRLNAMLLEFLREVDGSAG
jgi:3-oxoadipate enol-lactonase